MALTIASDGIRLERPRRPARWLAVASLGSFGASAALMGTGATGGLGVVATLGALGLLGGFALAVAAVLSRFFMRARTKPVGEAKSGSIVIDDDDVRVAIGDEERRFNLSVVKLGWTDAEGDAVIELHSGERLHVSGLVEKERSALLRALGTASSERVMETTIAPPYQSSQSWLRKLAAAAIPIVSLGVLSAPCALIPSVIMAVELLKAGNLAGSALTLAMAAAFMAVMATAAFGMVRFYRQRRVRVGTDGLRIGGVLKAQFIRYGEITDVRAEGHNVVLTSERGPDHVLVGADPALAIRIREAMAAQQQRRSSGVRVELLERGERDAEAWRSDLAALTQTSGRYRDRGLNAQQLAEVVEDPGCPPERRVAAAYALSHSADEPARRRIRIAAEASADDHLRQALEEAAAGELSERKLRRCARDSKE